MTIWLYILECADGSYYVGTTRRPLEMRVAEHQRGSLGGYTAPRRPVKLVFAEHFERILDGIAAERQIKGWSRAKKAALIAGDFTAVRAASGSLYRRRESSPAATSLDTVAARPTRDEEEEQ